VKAFEVRIVVQGVEVDGFGGSRVTAERTAITIPVDRKRYASLRDVVEALRTVVDVEALTAATIVEVPE
jgi:hypothetical protein